MVVPRFTTRDLTKLSIEINSLDQEQSDLGLHSLLHVFKKFQQTTFVVIGALRDNTVD